MSVASAATQACLSVPFPRGEREGAAAGTGLGWGQGRSRSPPASGHHRTWEHPPTQHAQLGRPEDKPGCCWLPRSPASGCVKVKGGAGHPGATAGPAAWRPHVNMSEAQVDRQGAQAHSVMLLHKAPSQAWRVGIHTMCSARPRAAPRGVGPLWGREEAGEALVLGEAVASQVFPFSIPWASDLTFVQVVHDLNISSRDLTCPPRGSRARSCQVHVNVIQGRPRSAAPRHERALVKS